MADKTDRRGGAEAYAAKRQYDYRAVRAFVLVVFCVLMFMRFAGDPDKSWNELKKK